MEIEVSASNTTPSPHLGETQEESAMDRVRVKRKTLQSVLVQCQKALEFLKTTDGGDDEEDSDGGARDEEEEEVPSRDCFSASSADCEADELCDLLKSRVECADFIQKLEHAKVSASQNISEEGSSWDMINENDLWEGYNDDDDQDDYVLVRQEDIVEGIACFMAAYLLSLKQTKELSPNQLQKALSKTFSVKKKKGRLQKAWDGSKVIYNVASWGATAIGIYQNPLLLKVASKAFWTSCDVISKLL